MLGKDLNPRLTSAYAAIIARAGMSRDSRVLHNALAMGSISTEPSRERGTAETVGYIAGLFKTCRCRRLLSELSYRQTTKNAE